MRLFYNKNIEQNASLFLERYTSWQAKWDTTEQKYNYRFADTIYSDLRTSFHYRMNRIGQNNDTSRKIVFIGDSMLDGFDDGKTKPIDYYLDSFLLHKYLIFNCSKSSIALEHQKLFEDYFDTKYPNILKIRTICMFDDFIPDLFLETKTDQSGNKYIALNNSKYKNTLDEVYQAFPWMRSAVLQKHFYTPMAVYARYQMSKKPEVIDETTRYFSDTQNTILLIIPPSFAMQENELYMKILGYDTFKEKLIADLKSKKISYYFIDDLLDKKEISYQEDNTHFDNATNKRIAKSLANRFFTGK